MAVEKRPRRSTKVPRPEPSSADRDAFLSTAGGWKDLVDTDKLIENIYESRSISSRPPIQLSSTTDSG
jgi:hypothetical protein